MKGRGHVKGFSSHQGNESPRKRVDARRKRGVSTFVKHDLVAGERREREAYYTFFSKKQTGRRHPVISRASEDVSVAFVREIDGRRGPASAYHSSDVVHHLTRKEKKSRSTTRTPGTCAHARLPSRQLEYFRLTLQPRTRRSNERCIAQLATSGTHFFCH